MATDYATFASVADDVGGSFEVGGPYTRLSHRDEFRLRQSQPAYYN